MDAITEQFGDLGQIMFAGIADLNMTSVCQIDSLGRAGVGNVIRIDEQDVGRVKPCGIEVLIAEEANLREGSLRFFLPSGTATDDTDRQCTGMMVELVDKRIFGDRLFDR